MKQIVLVVMTILTLAAPANATSDWDMFWGTTVPNALDPAQSGWNDFWYQCQDPNKGFGDCVGTVAAGIGAVIALPLVAAGAAVAGAGVVAGTAAGVGGGAATAIVATPGTGLYIVTAGVLIPVMPSVVAGGQLVALTMSGGFVLAI